MRANNATFATVAAPIWATTAAAACSPAIGMSSGGRHNATTTRWPSAGGGQRQDNTASGTGTDSAEATMAQSGSDDGDKDGSGNGGGGKPAARSLAIDEERRLTFDQIYQKYEVKIFNLIYRQVNNYDDAQDLLAITFTNAYRAWDRFRGDAKVSTWLYQIAINNCRNHFTQRQRRRENEAVSLDDAIDTDSGELGREVADYREIPEQALLDKEFSAKLQEAIQALRPEYREALILREAEGLSYEEIAEVTGQSVPAIKTRLHRARLMVRQRLEPYYRGWVGNRGGSGSNNNDS